MSTVEDSEKTQWEEHSDSEGRERNETSALKERNERAVGRAGERITVSERNPVRAQ